jgi:hypothetical protein
MILITGASGQIGVDLADELVRRHGPDTVLVTDLRMPEKQRPGRIYDVLDVTYMESVEKIIQSRDISVIYHLAGILSATGERHPELAWNVNVNGVRNVLEAARRFGCRVFWPSSIAVFGPTTPKVDTPQATVTEPGTMYGATKVTGELLCKFHATHHDLIRTPTDAHFRITCKAVPERHLWIELRTRLVEHSDFEVRAQLHTARIWFDLSQHHLDHAGFSNPVRPDKGHAIAALNGDRQFFHDLLIAKGFGQILNLNDLLT